MTDPLRRLKYLPWRSLLQVSGLTLLIVMVLEFLLASGATQSSGIYQLLSILYTPPLGTLILFAMGVGVGALAVYLLERFFPQVFINAGSLWALVPCLALFIFLKSLLPIPALVNLNYSQLIAIILGVFWKGRPYWR
jgi:hypothetical protein